MNRLLARLLVCCMVLISGCVPPHVSKEKPVEKKAVAPQSQQRDIPLSVSERLVLPGEAGQTTRAKKEDVFSFEARGLDIKDALMLFARVNQLNIVPDSDLTGKVTVSFHNLPLDQAMAAILDSHGYYWKKQGVLITVHHMETRLFHVNYIRLTRSDKGNSNATVSTGGTGGAGGGEAGSVSLEHEDKINFWDELQDQLESMVSKGAGNIVINRISGTIQVSDTHSKVEAIAEFLNQVNAAVHRQVEIQVEIVEVTLNSDQALGIDWSRVNPGQLGLNFVFSTATAITNTAAGNAALPPTFNGTVTNNNARHGDVSAAINALKDQGDVKVISKPKIVTLNNQSAMIKVGTDRTFFKRTTQVTPSAVGLPLTNSTDTPQVVTEGIVLHVTPQISAENWVILDVSPVITRVASVSTAVDANGVVTSVAPNLDIRQSASLVRVATGETVVLGGLIQDETSNNAREIPGLGSLPGVGKAFSSTYKSKRKKELVIFMTPHVIADDSVERRML